MWKCSHLATFGADYVPRRDTGAKIQRETQIRAREKAAAARLLKRETGYGDIRNRGASGRNPYLFADPWAAFCVEGHSRRQKDPLL